MKLPWRCLASVLLGITSFCDPAIAADGVTVLTAARPSPVERRALPETAPGGTVVLRGDRSASPNAGQPVAGGNGGGNGSTANRPPGALCPIGWDCDHVTTGLDRSGLSRDYDTVGFDRGGLSRP